MDVLRAQRISSAGRRGSSRPLIVETDAGARIVKLRGAAQGAGPLVAEVIVGELAEVLGLAVIQRRSHPESRGAGPPMPRFYGSVFTLRDRSSTRGHCPPSGRVSRVHPGSRGGERV